MDDRFQLAEEPQRKSQLGMWIVAGCLLAVLVVYHAWGGEEKKDEKYTPQKPVAATSITESKVNTKARQQQSIHWPAISFDELIDNNPFHPRQALEKSILGTSEEQAEVEAVKGELEASRKAHRRRQALARDLSSSDWKVRLLFQGARGATAVIGDRVVHEGDRIEGYQIVAIEHDGVILTPLTDADTASSESD